MNISDRIQKAKIRLIIKFPFYASLLAGLELIEDSTIPTACTNGLDLRINPDFWESLNLNEQIGLLAHEVLHPAFLHHTRRNGRDPEIWNEACDYAINKILLDAGVTLPSGALVDYRFVNKGAEEIYDVIYRDQDGKPQGGGGGGFGGVEDLPETDGDGNPISVEHEEQKQVQKVIGAGTLAGQGGGAVQRAIEKLIEPRVNWEDALAQIVSEKARDDYSYARKSDRYAYDRRLYMPSLHNDTYGDVALIVDTSISCTQEHLNIFSGECNSVAELTTSKKYAIYCDSDIAGVDEFEADDDVDFQFRGGGGTDFRPPFKWIDDQGIDPKIAIYFTDGECNRFPEPPHYPVIWAIYNGDENFDPPFGDVIHIPKL